MVLIPWNNLNAIQETNAIRHDCRGMTGPRHMLEGLNNRPMPLRTCLIALQTYYIEQSCTHTQLAPYNMNKSPFLYHVCLLIDHRAWHFRVALAKLACLMLRLVEFVAEISKHCIAWLLGPPVLRQFHTCIHVLGIHVFVWQRLEFEVFFRQTREHQPYICCVHFRRVVELFSVKS